VADPVVVIKIGGSVLTDVGAFGRVAEALARERVNAESRRERLIVVVSAERGMTDALLETARRVAPHAGAEAVDLLLSIGEVRSVALLMLALQRLGVQATGANVHQTGLVRDQRDDAVRLRPLRLRALLAAHDVVVVPGFVARTAGDGVTTLGRGGSDLSAVAIAAGLQAVRCELVKDVGGYFSADPRRTSSAESVPSLDYERALAMAEAGCELVQRDALEAARTAGVTIVLRTLDGRVGTVVQRDQRFDAPDALACGAGSRE
jgi:aspartate kinase